MRQEIIRGLLCVSTTRERCEDKGVKGIVGWKIHSVDRLFLIKQCAPPNGGGETTNRRVEPYPGSSHLYKRDCVGHVIRSIPTSRRRDLSSSTLLPSCCKDGN